MKSLRQPLVFVTILSLLLAASLSRADANGAASAAYDAAAGYGSATLNIASVPADLNVPEEAFQEADAATPVTDVLPTLLTDGPPTSQDSDGTPVVPDGAFSAAEFQAAATDCTPGPNKSLAGCAYNGQDISGANFAGSDLRAATFNGANASGSNFSNANLTAATLNGANLSCSNFDGANLTSATLDGANLSGSSFNGAILTSVTWGTTTTCPDGTNSGANGATCIGHLDPVACGAATSTATSAAVATATSTSTATATATNTATATATATNTATATAISTNTPTATSTATNTPTATSIATDTPTNTATATGTALATDTPTNTATATSTAPATNTPANAAPNAVDDDASFDVGVPYSLNVLLNDSDSNGDALSIESFTQPAGNIGTVVIDAAGILTFIPNDANFVGDVVVTYTIIDGNGGQDTATVTLHINAATNTATATGTAINTATSTATNTATATGTAINTATSTATNTATATGTAINTATSMATNTATATATGTAQATNTETATGTATVAGGSATVTSTSTARTTETAGPSAVATTLSVQQLPSTGGGNGRGSGWPMALTLIPLALLMLAAVLAGKRKERRS